MKGWLDKYGNNINANEGTSSAPEGWVGEGYSTKGRNYSPAWGGQFQKGGKLTAEDEANFQEFFKTLPMNLRKDSPDYNMRGYWDALGRPTEFDYTQPKEDDGYYHAFSRHPETGEILKSPQHVTFKQAIEEDRKAGYFPIVTPEGTVKTITGKQFAMGGSLPGSVGFTYARTNSPAPSEGPYAKKTLPSAQDGKYIQNYLNKMNQEYKDWYSVNKGKDDGFDSFYYDYLQPKSPMITRTIPAWEIRSVDYPDDVFYLEGEELDKLTKKKIQQGKLTGKFIKDYTTTGRDVSMDEFNADLTRYLQNRNRSEQKNGGMTYYQNGLDWKPRNISENGSLIPIAQTGKFVLPSARDIARANMPASESTAITFQTPKGKKSTATTGQKKEDVKASSEAMGKAKRTEERMKAQRIAERKAAVAAKDQGKPFTLPTGETKTYEQMSPEEQMYVSGKALEQRGRINENDEAWYDDLSPLYWTTGAAAGLAEAPLQAKLSNSNLPYLQAIAEPLIGGALGFDPLGAAMKVPGKVAQSMESGVLSNLTPKYYKSAADRTWPQRFGETYSNITDEYKALKKMHEISPENVVKPYDLKLDAEGNVLGYKMQKFKGQNLNEYINSGKELSPEIKQQIRETVGKLHDAGLAHGDLFGNIMINDKGNKFKIIDPVGYLPEKIFPNFSEAKLEDLGVLDELLGKEVLKQKKGGVVKDNMGYWNPDNWGKVVEIDSPDITMQGVNQPLLGISDEGDVQYMEPGKDYKFEGSKVTEIPLAQKGKSLPIIYTDDLRKIRSNRDTFALQAAAQKYMQDRRKPISTNEYIIDDKKFIKNVPYSQAPRSGTYETVDGRTMIFDKEEAFGSDKIKPTSFKVYKDLGTNRYFPLYEPKTIMQQKPKQKPKPKPTVKPEPTLKKKVLNVEPIRRDVSIAPPKVTELRTIDKTPTSTKETYNWNVEYFDPITKKTATKTFTTNQEAEEFYNNPANRASRKYSDVSGVGRFKSGGWLDKYK